MGWVAMLIVAPLVGAVTGASESLLMTDGLLTSFEEDELVPDKLPEVDVAIVWDVAGTAELVVSVAVSAVVSPTEHAV